MTIPFRGGSDAALFYWIEGQYRQRFRHWAQKRDVSACVLRFLRYNCRPMMNQKPKKKKGNVVSDYLLYLLVRLVVGIFYCFPVNANLKTACLIGRLMWRHYHRGRLRALENLRASFPDKDEAWLIETGRKSFEHLVMMAMDVLFTPKVVHLDRWQAMFRFQNIERVKWLMKEEKGLIMVTGHYGNFEIIGYLMSLYGLNIYSIARPLDNRFINHWLMSVRQSKGQKIIYKKGAAEMTMNLPHRGRRCALSPTRMPARRVFLLTFSDVKPVPIRV